MICCKSKDLRVKRRKTYCFFCIFVRWLWCDNMTSVYYKGTAEEWTKISIGSSNYELTDATRYYYSEEQPTAKGNYWHYVDSKPTHLGIICKN